MDDLKQKYGPIALVTGASSGIGKEFAIQLAALRFDLILVARNTNALEELKKDLEREAKSRGQTIAIHLITQDLSQPHGAAAVQAYLQMHNLQVGLLINNAGSGLLSEFGQKPIQDELSMIDLNCRAVVDLTYRLLTPMKKQQRGGIIIVASTASRYPLPYFAVYTATKSFDLMFGASLYGELKGSGVDVLSLLPGYTTTNFQKAAGLNISNISARTAPQVVTTALKALGRRPLVVDGLLNRISWWLAPFIPLALMQGVVRRALRPLLKA